MGELMGLFINSHVHMMFCYLTSIFFDFFQTPLDLACESDNFETLKILEGFAKVCGCVVMGALC